MNLMRSESPRQGQAPRRPKVSREHGACEACKASKTKCDGGEPCGACRKEKRKSRPCQYSEKALRMRNVKREQQKKNQLHDDAAPEPEDVTYHENLGQPPHTEGGYDEEYPAHPVRSRIEFRLIVDEFVNVKSTVKGAVLANISRIQDLWKSLSTSTTQNATDELFIPDSEPHGDGAEAYQAKLENILAKVNQGKLREAYTRSGSLVREMESSAAMLSSQTSPDTNSPIEGIYVKLLEYDCMLAFFQGGWPYLPPWVKSRYLKNKSTGEDSIIKDKLEVIDQVQTLLSMDTSTDAGIVDFAHFVHDIRDDARSPTALIRMAFCINSSHTAEHQRIRLFANLVLAAMYCRAASICDHCSHKAVPATNGTRADIVVNDGYHKARTKTDHCKSLVKHAGMALEAFDRLCEFDTEATSGDYFLLHGAIAAATLMGLHAVREKNATWEGKEGREGKDGTKGDKSRLQDALGSFKRVSNHASTSPVIGHALKIIPDILRARSPRPRPDGGRDPMMSRDDEDSDCSQCSDSSPEAMDSMVNMSNKSLKRGIDQVNNSQYSTAKKLQKLNTPTVPQHEGQMFSSSHMRTLPTDYSHTGTNEVDPNLARAIEYGQPQTFTISQPFPTSNAQSVSQVSMANSQPGFLALDGTPYQRPVYQKQELRIPQSIPDNAFTDQEQRVYIDPSYPSPHEHPGYTTSPYPHSMPDMRSSQQMPSPSVNQHQSGMYGQSHMGPSHRQNSDNSATFFNSTQKNYETPRSLPLDPTLTDRPGAPTRRHSELSSTHYPPGPTEQHQSGQWKVEETRTSPLQEPSSAHLNMLPPRPESIVTYQQDPHAVPPQPFFPDYNATNNYGPNQMYDQYGMHPPMVLQDMAVPHYMGQQHYYHPQGVTMG